MEEALVVWVNSFESVHAGISSLSQLSDGQLVLSILSEMAPAHFDATVLGPLPQSQVYTSHATTPAHATTPGGGGNWALSASNLKRLIRMIGGYYKSVLHKEVSGLDTIDAMEIAKNGNVEELLSLLELVVGVAVMCEDKAVFIQKIFSLDSVSQSVLKGVVEQVMSRCTESNEDDVEFTRQNQQQQQQQQQQEEIISHLQNARQDLLQQVQQLQKANDLARDTTQQLREKLADFESEKSTRDTSEAQRDKMLASRAEQLQRDLDEAQRELDLKSVACDNLSGDLATLKQKLHNALTQQTKLEMENHQLSDELDVSRDKALKLAKAEAQIDKYQRKLEELPNLRKENKELVDKLDQYMDKIHELESSNKNITSMNKMIEQYKDKAVEMEREKFQAVSALQMHQHDFDRMARDLGDALDGKRFLEEELAGVRAELEQHMAVAAELNSSYFAAAHSSSSSSTTSSSIAGANAPNSNSEDGKIGAFETETVTSLREKLKLMEIELRDARALDGSAEGSEKDSRSVGGGGGGGAAAVRELTSELAIVKAELQLSTSVKQEREDMLMAAKKNVSELQLELRKSQRACAELEKAANKGNAAVASLKDTEHKLALCENTLRLLETNMKEKEGLISRLEQDKNKLETFSKSTLLAFKDKYMKALKAINDEKKSLEERLAIMTETNERNQVTSRREERLMLSALYEVGVKIMDRNNGPNTFVATPHKLDL